MNQNNFRADLHCHSNASDGSSSPEEIILLAKKAGLKGVSITDHDTMDAYQNSLFELAKKEQIELLTGVEISSDVNHKSVHILGYKIDHKNSSFCSFLESIQEARTRRNQQILEKLTEHQMPITEEELLNFTRTHFPFKGKVIGRPHIALLMQEKGYVKDYNQAFKYYLNDEGSCYVSGEKESPLIVIEKIHQVGGKAVLAHPHFYKDKNFVRRLLELPFDGIECYYAKIDPSTEKKWVDIAKQRGLIATGGSDFHGEVKPHIPLGCSWVGEETFYKLFR